jgi:hypothetical protein
MLLPIGTENHSDGKPRKREQKYEGGLEKGLIAALLGSNKPREGRL